MKLVTVIVGVLFICTGYNDYLWLGNSKTEK